MNTVIRVAVQKDTSAEDQRTMTVHLFKGELKPIVRKLMGELEVEGIPHLLMRAAKNGNTMAQIEQSALVGEVLMEHVPEELMPRFLRGKAFWEEANAIFCSPQKSLLRMSIEHATWGVVEQWVTTGVPVEQWDYYPLFEELGLGMSTAPIRHAVEYLERIKEFLVKWNEKFQAE